MTYETGAVIQSNHCPPGHKINGKLQVEIHETPKKPKVRA